MARPQPQLKGAKLPENWKHIGKIVAELRAQAIAAKKAKEGGK